MTRSNRASEDVRPHARLQSGSSSCCTIMCLGQFVDLRCLSARQAMGSVWSVCVSVCGGVGVGGRGNNRGELNLKKNLKLHLT